MAKAALWGIGHATNDCTRRRGSEAAAGQGGSSGAGAQPPSLEPLGICLRLIGEWDSQLREFQGGGDGEGSLGKASPFRGGVNKDSGSPEAGFSIPPPPLSPGSYWDLETQYPSPLKVKVSFLKNNTQIKCL